MRRALMLLSLGALALPASAAAADPAAPALTVRAEQVGSSRSVLPGAHWRLRVTARPFVEGQTVTVRLYRSGERVSTLHVALARSADGLSGAAVAPRHDRMPGALTIRATQLATPATPTLRARQVRVRVLALRAGPGARGPVVRLLQRRLAGRGYVVGRRGLYDDRTARAVLALRKVAGMARTTYASTNVFRLLARGGGRFRVRFPSHGKHVETDLSRQVLALIRGRRVQRIYPISSGKPSTPTVLGSFRVYSKTPGTNAKGMVYSSYFIRGYAIHGYYTVPIFAASHGCVRVPVPDAIPIFSWLAYGDIVDVYP